MSRMFLKEPYLILLFSLPKKQLYSTSSLDVFVSQQKQWVPIVKSWNSCKHLTPKDEEVYQLTADTTMCSTAVDWCYLWAVSSSKWSQVNYYSAETGLGTSGQAPPTYERVMGYWACLCLAPGPTNAQMATVQVKILPWRFSRGGNQEQLKEVVVSV